MFPSLSPRTPVLPRGPHEVRLGLEPDEAVVLTGLSPDEMTSLTHLDGSTSLAALAEPNSRLETVVLDLARRGLVVDARATVAPLPARVAVQGCGATTDLLVGLLRGHGVSVVHGPTVLDELDLALRADRPSLVGEHVDLVVRVGAGALSPVAARLKHIPCLPVLVGDRSVSVGPVVTTVGPCLSCLDLTRADHDPAWGHVLAHVQHLREPELSSPLTALGASLAGSRVLTRLRIDDHERSDAESVEMCLEPPRVCRRTWARHPRCRGHATL